MTSRISVPALLVALIFNLPAIVPAATHYVSVDSRGFSPSALTIETGDEVIWVNLDDTFSHTTTSTLPLSNPNYWNAILFDEFDTFAKTFSTLGTFNYSDQLDIGTGNITVVASTPASIHLTTPRVEAGVFLFEASGLTIGNFHVLQSSTNLTTWTSLSTNVTLSSAMTFTNPPPSSTRIFFRIYEIQ